MDTNQLRIHVATQMRELGHAFMASELTNEELQAMSAQLAEISALTSKAPTRVRELRASGVTGFKMDVPAEGAAVKHQLFADSIVSGGANPMSSVDCWLSAAPERGAGDVRLRVVPIVVVSVERL